jgi:Mrp family chromosome partitioning ATPase
VTDAAVLSRLAEGTVVVVGADRTHRHQLEGALEALDGVNARVLGVVLNKVARRDASRYGYDYGYAPYASTPTRPESSNPGPSGTEPAVTSGSEPSVREDQEGSGDATSHTWPPAEREQARR